MSTPREFVCDDITSEIQTLNDSEQETTKTREKFKVVQIVEVHWTNRQEESVTVLNLHAPSQRLVSIAAHRPHVAKLI